MKKFILALAAMAIVSLGSSPAFAQDPEPGPGSTVPDKCAESDGRDDEKCLADYYPPTSENAAVTTPDPAISTKPPVPSAPPDPPNLPTTGSGISSTLGIGALLLLTGSLVVVAARRRSTATNPVG